jgi:hypothetical protein
MFGPELAPQSQPRGAVSLASHGRRYERELTDDEGNVMHRPRWLSWPPLSIALALALGITASVARADAPGIDGGLDEPGITITDIPEPANDAPAFRVELAFGLSSLVVDPDINQGIGGGIYVAYGLQSWIGVEATVFASHNTYKGQLGDASAAFSGGNISLGPIFQLTKPGARFSVTIDTALGFYHVVPTVQEGIWTLGISLGATIGVRLTSWFGIGIKPRYHLHNLANVSGPELLDLKSLRRVGVVDRLEVPAYAAFYF